MRRLMVLTIALATLLIVANAFSQSDCCTGIRGNANMDPNDEITLGDISAIIGYVYLGQPLECPEEADVNADGVIDPYDIEYLTNYLFNGGPAPYPCPGY